ncbi:MAG: hypothetical protein K1X75_03755 [Leptospirales bacterium]|nr:hypothetical protein [Leptospirales bacterium]
MKAMYDALRRLLAWLAGNPRGLLLGILLPALVLRLLAAILNLGYFAVDDYTVLSNAIPVQLSVALHSQHGQLNLGGLAGVEDIRNPLPQMLVFGVAWLAHQFGAENALNQVRAVFAAMGLISMISIVCGWRILAIAGRMQQAAVAGLLLGFHWLQPFFSTRSMIENMAAPFIMLALLQLSQYWIAGRRRSLFYSMIWLALAAMLRFQAGILILCYPLLLYQRKDWKGFGVAALGGIVGLIVSGLPDWFVSGQFHGSVIKYIDFNLKHASQHGVSPFYAYLPVAIVICLPPAFLSRYRGFGWRDQYRPLLPAALFAAVFFVSHSIVPHKEDRFLAPVLPVFLLLLAPMAAFLLEQGRRPLMLLWFLSANVVLLLMLALFTFQNNVIGLVRYMENPRIQRLLVFEDSLTYYPYVYGQRPGLKAFGIVTHFQPAPQLSPSCDEVLVVRGDYAQSAALQLNGLSKVAEFRASPLEQITVFLNPSGGGRRSPMLVYSSSACADQLRFGD